MLDISAEFRADLFMCIRAELISLMATDERRSSDDYSRSDEYTVREHP